MSPDGRTVYIATDAQGLVEASDGGATTKLSNPGAILAFTYEGEGGPETSDKLTSPSQSAAPSASAKADVSSLPGVPPRFTAAQVRSGKAAYDENCAVCHGSTMTNGTFGTPLAGTYFENKWFGRTVGELYEHARTMPPTSPGSLAADTYAEILAYILEVNGFKPGEAKLPAGGAELREMRIK